MGLINKQLEALLKQTMYCIKDSTFNKNISTYTNYPNALNSADMATMETGLEALKNIEMTIKNYFSTNTEENHYHNLSLLHKSLTRMFSPTTPYQLLTGMQLTTYLLTLHTTLQKIKAINN